MNIKEGFCKLILSGMPNLPKITNLLILFSEWLSWFFTCREAWKLPTNQYDDFYWDDKHSQGYQSSKFAMSLQYLREEGSDQFFACS